MDGLTRLKLQPLFDEIVVFAGGTVVERGTLPDPLPQEGELARLWRSYDDVKDRMVR